jgi:hypothetical protein
MVQGMRLPTQAERRKIHGIVTTFQLLLFALLTCARIGLVDFAVPRSTS